MSDTPAAAPAGAADVLILGGGTAGCLLAARLSADPRCRVVLVEAGADISPGAVPEDIGGRYPGRAFLNPAHIWPGLTATMGAPHGNVAAPPRRYEQARVLGGGSSINAMAANRGAPGDYDEWAALGATGWDWASVKPHFLRLESDLDFGGPDHGADGPISISRYFRDRHSPFVRSVCAVLERAGHTPREDQNGAWQDGIFPVAIARDRDGRRVSAATALLTAAVRARPNLSVLARTRAQRLVFEGRRATGAEVMTPSGPAVLRAAQVVLTCGAIHTPALLMRSGIGPAAELARHGIAPVAALEGVGGNLMEHPSMALSAWLPRGARLAGADTHQIHACLRFSSGLDDAPPGDLHMAIVAKSAWHGVGKRLGTLLVWLNKSQSRGTVRLRGPDPDAVPEVDFRLLSDPSDRRRLIAGLRLAARTLRDPAMRAVAGTPFPAAFSDRVRKVTTPSGWNAVQTALFGAMLDLAGPARDWLVRNVITRGVTLDALLADDAAMERFLMAAVGGTWHASGTCRMGADTDPLAVTDPAGRVRGVEALRVCDASLMPSIPRANTNMPTLMIADRIADMMLAERAEAPRTAAE